MALYTEGSFHTSMKYIQQVKMKVDILKQALIRESDDEQKLTSK